MVARSSHLELRSHPTRDLCSPLMVRVQERRVLASGQKVWVQRLHRPLLQDLRRSRENLQLVEADQVRQNQRLPPLEQQERSQQERSVVIRDSLLPILRVRCLHRPSNLEVLPV